MGTLDAHLVAIDAKNGKAACGNVSVADDKLAYSITLAPLVVKDKVIVGVGGAGVRHSRVRGRLTSEERAGAVALLHDPGKASRQRNLVRASVGARRRIRVWVTGSYDPGART
jgi:hypothetical protein